MEFTDKSSIGGNLPNFCYQSQSFFHSLCSAFISLVQIALDQVIFVKVKYITLPYIFSLFYKNIYCDVILQSYLNWDST